MSFDPSGHPVFRDFKDIRFKFDLTVCYPAGAGGNFLLYLVDANANGRSIPWADNNEFKHDTSMVNLIDFVDLQNAAEDSKPIKPILDMMHDIAKKRRLEEDYRACNGLISMKGHLLPLMFSSVYTYHTNELIVIDIKPEHHWMVKVLQRYKLNVMRDFDLLSAIDVINTYHQSGLDSPIEFQDFVSCRTHLTRENPFPTDIRNKQIMLDYYIWLKKEGKDTDLNTFGDYVHEMIFKQNFSQIDYGNRLKMLRNDCYSSVTFVDYVDLFFRCELPSTGALSRLEAADLEVYKKKNLKMIRSMIDILPMQHQQEYSEKLNRILHP